MKAIWRSFAALLIVGAVGCASTETQDDSLISSPMEEEETMAVEEPMVEEPVIRETRPMRTPAGEVVRQLRDVHFDYDKAMLREGDKRILVDNADLLKANGHVRVSIEGHCDERGTTAYNLALGERRAAAVQRYLIALGVSPGQLSTVSYGEEKQVCFSSTESCWSQNRRAHFSAR